MLSLIHVHPALYLTVHMVSYCYLLQLCSSERKACGVEIFSLVVCLNSWWNKIFNTSRPYTHRLVYTCTRTCTRTFTRKIHVILKSVKMNV